MKPNETQAPPRKAAPPVSEPVDEADIDFAEVGYFSSEEEEPQTSCEDPEIEPPPEQETLKPKGKGK